MSPLALLLLAVLASPGLGAKEPPTITIPGQGMVMGTYKTMVRTQRIAAYLGLPFAQPPTGMRRFRAPQVAELPMWEGIRNASQPAPTCLQDVSGSRAKKKHDELFYKLLKTQADEQEERVYDEDCLYLNVYVPDGPSPTGGYATMVWIHSGDFMWGSPYDINPFQLVFKQKVIVVTIAYRLNIFGFFTTMDGESPGNFGLMDQAVALEWVRNNIEAFGGNKNNVCIFGQGTGAISAGLHLISAEWSIKTFQKIIAMSGNVLASNVVKPASKEVVTINRIAEVFGCFRRPTSDLISCLRNVDSQILLDQGEPLTEWGPIIDVGLSNETKPFISDYPMKLFEKDMYDKVPMLLGFTNMEDALLLNKEDVEDAGITKAEYDSMVNDIILADLSQENSTCLMNLHYISETVSFFYDPIPATQNETILRQMFLNYYMEKNHGAPAYMLAKYMSKHVPTFAYRFDLKPLSAAVNDEIPDWVGVVHNFDLVYVLGLPYLASPVDLGRWESSDKRIADIIMKMFANFAMYNNPTNSGVYITWEMFKPENPGFLIIDRSFNMSGPGNINYKAFEFWNDYFPKVIDMSGQCCNDNSSAYSFHHPTYTNVFSLGIVTVVIPMLVSYNFLNGPISDRID